MTKKSSLVCVMAAMLYMGIAVAADNAEAQQAAQPTASQTPETPSKPKEEPSTSPSQSTTTPSKEEPDCNN